MSNECYSVSISINNIAAMHVYYLKSNVDETISNLIFHTTNVTLRINLEAILF